MWKFDPEMFISFYYSDKPWNFHAINGVGVT